MKFVVFVIFIVSLLVLQCFCESEESPSLLADLQARLQALETMQHVAKQQIFALQSKLGELHYVYDALAAAANLTASDILPN